MKINSIEKKEFKHVAQSLILYFDLQQKIEKNTSFNLVYLTKCNKLNYIFKGNTSEKLNFKNKKKSRREITNLFWFAKMRDNKLEVIDYSIHIKKHYKYLKSLSSLLRND